ncbi:DUF1800 family protein [Pseudacidobacterium ailaaui]|uniref:DUF1800 family protein n=1 Tax=Pseudacidobacterium ailaaui TaxID=1382359 RepID=UPI00138DD6AE|nr:DUF1800 family protein [Pseudacidobacterium ailaaui]
MPLIFAGYCIGCGSKGGTGAPTLSITGPAQVRLGGTAQYAITDTGASSPSVVWTVTGGGTISSAGLYTAPPVTGSVGVATISAYLASNPSIAASVSVSVINPIPSISTVSVDVGELASSITVKGSGFVPGSTLLIGQTAVTPSSITSTSMVARISTLSLQMNSIPVQVTNPDPGSASSNVATLAIPQPAATITAATRLLDQASFGPTLAAVSHVQSVGINGYLQEQFAMQPSLVTEMPNTYDQYAHMYPSCQNIPDCASDDYFIQNMIFAPDQLRQRVVFALSKIWTVSLTSVPSFYFPHFLNLLSEDAFSNWRQIMQDVTMSPAMGIFLNSVNNMVQSPTDRPNENYARELLQVFSTGTSRLNEDGSLQVDGSGNPIPIYTQAQITAMAKVFTGLTFANEDCSTPSAPIYLPPNDNTVFGANCPMAILDSYHDHTEKHIINGVVLPAGQNTQADISQTLDAIFQDPDLPPFIVKQLIQNLVKSDPSPDYVQRIVNVFKDNGSGVRGDMKAVLQAILLDPEARAGDDPSAERTDAGHLRDPILWFMAVTRALNPSLLGPPNDISAVNYLDYYLYLFGEQPNDAPSVFGYYSPQYRISGANIPAPEFELELPATLFNEAQILDAYILTNRMSPQSDGATIYFDTSASGTLGTLASQGPDALLDAISVLFYHGQMTSAMRTAFEGALQGLPPDQMVRVAVYLAATSPQFRVIQ